MSNPVDPNYIRLPYPADSDRRVRHAAEYVEYEAAIKALDTIKNELCGNAERAGEISGMWRADETMLEGKDRLNYAKDHLASYWRGPAYNAFSSYTGNVVGVHDKDLVVMGTIATTLGSSVQTVFSTYASAIGFIGKCVANLGQLGAWTAIAAATAEIPGVDIVTAAALANKILDTLVNFVKDVTTLIADAVTQIGQYKAQGIAFAVQAGQFQHPELLPDSTGHTGEWRVNPNR
ncbi:MAG: hypothetical protein ACJ72N_09900 [Labedaea sp.]